MREQITVTYYEEGDVHVFSDGMRLYHVENFPEEAGRRGYIYSEEFGWRNISHKPWITQTVVEREFREPDI
jgi:hypothetical protein